jgi:type II secretory pathway component GspD/PulD (secretin)
MDLHPEVSDLASGATVQGGLIINTSEADTRVMVDDGQTAVIGGLIRTNETMVHFGVPILKDIPLVGLLFSTKSTSKQNRELIIFVTPKLVTEVAAVDTAPKPRTTSSRRRSTRSARQAPPGLPPAAPLRSGRAAPGGRPVTTLRPLPLRSAP